MTSLLDIAMPVDALTINKLRRLKWATTLVVIGIPVVAQVLGAMILFVDKHPFITSFPVIIAFCLSALCVLFSGIYVVLNRMHLRFSGLNSGLDEWEKGVQIKAQAFSYRIIFRAVLAVFILVSALGIVGALGVLPMTETGLGLSMKLNISALSALVVSLFYLIFFLPTLYMAWTLKPLGN